MYLKSLDHVARPRREERCAGERGVDDRAESVLCILKNPHFDISSTSTV
jgi:hypothetical protein